MGLFVGVDPGKRGATAFIDKKAKIIHTERHSDSILDFYNLIKKHKKNIEIIYLEKAQARPNQGVCSMFTYGIEFGKLQTALEILKVNYRLISPSAWHNFLINSKEFYSPKEKALAKAKELWDESEFIPRGCRKPHDGVVDALLLAEYGRLKANG